MHWFSNGVALLAAIGIIAIGIMYLLQPRVMTFNFGLPLPEEGRNIVWWLRLKGSRDIVSGLVVLALMAWGSPYLLGIVLLIEAIIPTGDMSLGRADDPGCNPLAHGSGLRCCTATRSGFGTRLPS